MKEALLWKRILYENFCDHGLLNVEQVQERIIQAPIIVDSRPADTFKLIDTRQLGHMAVPFDEFWLEGSDEVLDDPDTKGGRWGALLKFARAKDGAWLGMLIAFGGGVQTRVNCFGMGDLKLDAIGNPDLSRCGNWWKPPAMERECAIEAFNSIIALSMDTLTLLGCKNVSLVERDNEPKSARVATKRHGPSSIGYRYHVLTVRPAGSKPGTPGTEIGAMPRHVCRGHFSEYGPEFGKGLLFGKYAGRFFVPPHVKGKSENGIVEKDYRIA